MSSWKDLVVGTTTIKTKTTIRTTAPSPSPTVCNNPAALVPEGRKTMLDHALEHAGRGLHVFPCEEFLGLPLVDNWYSAATTKREKLVQWWSDTPDADIAAIPEKSGHYVIVVTGEAGRDSLARFEEEHGVLKPAFRYVNFWDSEHLWFTGSSHSARIDECLHLVGAGRYVYLSPSHAPDALSWRK
jgi:hypothetical protein